LKLESALGLNFAVSGKKGYVFLNEKRPDEKARRPQLLRDASFPGGLVLIHFWANALG
jgi:hypothetical protein